MIYTKAKLCSYYHISKITTERRNMKLLPLSIVCVFLLGACIEESTLYEIPACASQQALENIQGVAPVVLDIYDTFEAPANTPSLHFSGPIPYLSHEDPPEYREDARTCFAKAMTENGRTTIKYESFIQSGVGGEQLYIEVGEVPEAEYQIVKEWVDENPPPSKAPSE
ncbi:MAG: hypothetical protein V2I43_11915 [Parvularcula sp.]|jgi:hypothetical protein|nr:hypothetical protein [Parvularcula sp.]